MEIKKIATKPMDGQKPGTGGLRARTKAFMQPGFLENFIQAVLNVRKRQGERLDTMVVGGDGRYPGLEFLPRIIKMLLANGVGKIIVVGRDLVATTPAVSHIIRKRRADGGFMLSASHNPGGPDGDFGVKIEMANGGQSPESVTVPVYEETKTIGHYLTLDISDEEALAAPEVEFVDAVSDYVELMRSMFDFPLIKKWFDAGNTFRFDCMNASTGPYAKAIFRDIFGAPASSILRGEPMGDFGGLHPEPNPTYAPEIYGFMMKGGADFACACDGDGDRDMILGKGVFVYPSDSLAVMTKHHRLVPYFRNGFKGVARSAPTSSAVDLVAGKMGIDIYRTPTGWKFFASLLDAGMISLCGEESFGQGGDYIREKDAIFAVLFWLNVMAATGKTARGLVEEMWAENGRVFYSQYSYEGVDKAGADATMEYIRGADVAGKRYGGFAIKSKEIFDYTDPATGAVSKDQGVEIFTADGVRIFFRLSGTGTVGATLRFYIEKFEGDKSKFGMSGQEYLKDVYVLVEEIFKLKETFGADIRPSAVN
ncbi:MAG: alpha-D-glucose phosphate-specific phosphoglucomutase [Rickettsiales bacterium]|jgi:phosphoglucomutase|nr:alpha-D-glucose phosphate-specific phosphoglucomutase [Rickettsiales bacterium]